MVNHLWLNVGCKVYNGYVPYEWNEYFKQIGDYRGMIYCDMKQIVAQRLAKEECVFSGMSSGGSVATALKLIEELDSGVVVAIICDRGDKYLSTDLFE